MPACWTQTMLFTCNAMKMPHASAKCHVNVHIIAFYHMPASAIATVACLVLVLYHATPVLVQILELSIFLVRLIP